MNQEGRFSLNWKIAVQQYSEICASWNNPGKTNVVKRKYVVKKLRRALRCKEGAKEYMEARKFNERNEVTERQFQIPPSIFEALVEKSERKKEERISTDDSNFEVMFPENKNCLHSS